MELFQTMQVFAKLAELGSFTKTADVLHMGRPQVTHVIQELESSLGVRLFQRTTRRVSLTAEGEAFYQRVCEILNSVSEATSLFSTNRENIRGRLRIDIPVALIQPSFMVSLHEFQRTFPEINLILGVTDRLLDLIAEGVDCAVRIGELPSSSTVGRRIGSVVMVTCASPRYLRKYGTPQSPQDLALHRAVNYFSESSRKPLDWRFKVNGKDTVCNVSSGILVNESNAFLEAGLAGFGIIQAPGASVEQHLISGDLVEVLTPYRPSARPISVLYPSRIHLAPQVRVFVDWIAEVLPKLHGKWLKS